MKITIENTSKIVTLDNVPARIWEGHTESGIPIHCYITRIAVDVGQDHSQFEAELKSMRPPSTEVEAIPMRLVL